MSECLSLSDVTDNTSGVRLYIQCITRERKRERERVNGRRRHFWPLFDVQRVDPRLAIRGQLTIGGFSSYIIPCTKRTMLPRRCGVSMFRTGIHTAQSQRERKQGRTLARLWRALTLMGIVCTTRTTLSLAFDGYFTIYI